MKAIKRLVLPTVLLTSALSNPIYADDSTASDVQPGGNGSNLASYLLNLGAYLGYNLSQQPPNVASPLLSSTCMQLFGSASACTGGGGNSQLPFFTAALDVLLGSIPVNPLYSQFVPTSNATYSALNAFANASFPSYSSTSSQQGANTSISANSAVDQQSFQQDPVSQAVLNILGTPDYSYCMNYSGSQWTGGDSTTSSNYPQCKYLYQYQIMGNAVGTLPNPDQLISYPYNQQFLSQLNSNTLLAPLLYSTTSSNSSASNLKSPGSQNNGLTAQTQLQQAANFIRYASGSVVPLSLPQLKDYNTLYMQATNATNNVPLSAQIQAQASLTQYLAKLRVFAAQSSIAYSNLYYIFSKRLPQNTSSSSANATSEALNEFTMATWRLYTPGGSANNNWLEQINKAPSATVQKEMVTLLAEINYQLYLSRQQQERLLLTETMILLQNTRAGQPAAPTVENIADSGSNG